LLIPEFHSKLGNYAP